MLFAHELNRDWYLRQGDRWRKWDGTQSPFGPVESLIDAGFAIPVTRDLANALRSAIRGEGRIWRKFAEQLFRRAKNDGFLLAVVGGAIRETILGRRDKIVDLDLCGNIPPGLFRKWIREISLATDANLTAHVSTTLVCHVKEVADSGATASVLEYAMLKHGKASGPAGEQVWVGSDDLDRDLATRDALQNCFMFCPYLGTEREPYLLCGDPNAGELFPEREPDIGAFRTALRPIPVSTYQLAGWKHVNQISRLLKSFTRMRLRGTAERAACLAPVASYLIDEMPAILADVSYLAGKFGLEPEMVVGSALRDGLDSDYLEAQSTYLLLVRALEDHPRAGTAAKAQLLYLVERGFSVLRGVWNAHVELVGDGLGPPVRNMDNNRYKTDAGVFSIAENPVGYEFSPRFVRTKLGTLVSGPNWRVGAVRGVVAREAVERLYRAHSDGKHIIVEYRDGRPLQAESGLPELAVPT